MGKVMSWATTIMPASGKNRETLCLVTYLGDIKIWLPVRETTTD